MSVTGPITRGRLLAWARSVPPHSVWWVDDDVLEAAISIAQNMNPYLRFGPDPPSLYIYSVKLCQKSRRHSVLNTP